MQFTLSDVAAATSGRLLFDDVDVEKVKDFQLKMTDYFTTRKAELLDRIAREKAVNDEIAGEL